VTIATNQLKPEIFYPHSDGKPMAESDSARDYLIYCVETLDMYFADRSDVYVSGNLFIYYRQGIPSAVVAPDVFVVFGIEKKKRLSYKVWEEGDRTPSFVMEITSASTQENDEQEKPIKYAALGIQEYFQYDPTGDYLDPQLKGRTLVNGSYQELPVNTSTTGELAIDSQILGLTLQLIDGELRFFDRSNKLLSHRETEQARQQAEAARQQAESARQQAITRLLAMGLTIEQVAEALGFTVEEVRSYRSN
jgi:Uma2 family endonuclease/DNA-binding CsgD family transcriptional regulator